MKIFWISTKKIFLIFLISIIFLNISAVLVVAGQAGGKVVDTEEAEDCLASTNITLPPGMIATSPSLLSSPGLTRAPVFYCIIGASQPSLPDLCSH